MLWCQVDGSRISLLYTGSLLVMRLIAVLSSVNFDISAKESGYTVMDEQTAKQWAEAAALRHSCTVSMDNVLLPILTVGSTRQKVQYPFADGAAQTQAI